MGWGELFGIAKDQIESVYMKKYRFRGGANSLEINIVNTQV